MFAANIGESGHQFQFCWRDRLWTPASKVETSQNIKIWYSPGSICSQLEYWHEHMNYWQNLDITIQNILKENMRQIQVAHVWLAWMTFNQYLVHMIKLYFENNLKTTNRWISCNIRKSTKNPAVISRFFLCYSLFTCFYTTLQLDIQA